jgi:hypothetical protein
VVSVLENYTGEYVLFIQFSGSFDTNFLYPVRLLASQYTIEVAERASVTVPKAVAIRRVVCMIKST